MSRPSPALACLTLAAALALSSPPARAANPLFPGLYTADPAALVDGQRVYLYVGRDEARPEDRDYVMHEWRAYSSCDMVNWREHGVPLKPTDFAWAKGSAWASDVIKRDGKYYFYATVKHSSIPGFSIGVAVADSPVGPFRDARGSALITNDMTTQTKISWDDIDPGVFMDDDGQAYLYWGNTVLKYVKLKPNMTEFEGPIQTVPVHEFTEAPYLHKRGKTYYLSYATQFPEYIAYMTGPSATGPWTPRGIVMDKNEGTKTIHQAFVDFNGKSYAFYHNAKLPGGGEWRRSVAVEEFRYNADGSIPTIGQTEAGPAPNPTPGCRP